MRKDAPRLGYMDEEVFMSLKRITCALRWERFMILLSWTTGGALLSAFIFQIYWIISGPVWIDRNFLYIFSKVRILLNCCSLFNWIMCLEQRRIKEILVLKCLIHLSHCILILNHQEIFNDIKVYGFFSKHVSMLTVLGTFKITFTV